MPQIFIKSMASLKTYSVDVNCDETIEQVKKKLISQFNDSMTVNNILLTDHKCKMLKNEQKLSDCQIGDLSTLFMMYIG